MKPSMTLAATAVFAAALISSGSSNAQDARDLTVEQNQVFKLEAPAKKQGELKVTAWVDQQDNTYDVGESLRLYIRANKPAHLAVVNVGPSGDVTLLFPNKFQPNDRIAADQVVEIPGKGSDSKIVVQKPVGAELIKVIVATKPFEFIPEDELEGSGVFRTIRGGIATLTRNLDMVASGSVEIAYYNKVIRTTDKTAADILQVVTGAAKPSMPEFESAFPLLLSVDRASYAIGDSVTMAVTALEDCHLTVFNLTADGKALVLFPNKLRRENKLSANQTMLISGGASPVKITPAGPAGEERVIAVCSRSNQPILDIVYDNEELFTRMGEADSALRDLSVNAAERSDDLGMAVLSFDVHEKK